MKSAYGQLARRPDDGRFTVVGAWSLVRQCVELFEQMVLAFGAASSFANLCLVAWGMWTIFVTRFQVETGQYERLPMIELESLAPHLQHFVDRVFDPWGWPTKQQDGVAQIFPALG